MDVLLVTAVTKGKGLTVMSCPVKAPVQLGVEPCML